MIGNATLFSVNGVAAHLEFTEYSNVHLNGTTSGNRMRRNQIGMFDCESIGCDWDARPNVSGQRQTKCHDFPDVEPDDPETPVLDDVEPVSDDSPLDTVETSGSPRQETVPYLVWFCLTKTPIKEMIAELQPHDRDDIRQDMVLKYWRKAVRQELRGDRIQGLTKWLTADVRQWIGERTDIATSEPLTKQQIDDAKGDTLLLQRSASEESRLEKLEHDLRIVQSQFAADVEAAKRAKQPKAILALKW